MGAHAKYMRAERALNAIATLSCRKIHARGDDSMSRSSSSKSILRLEGFLSASGISTWLKNVRHVLKTDLTGPGVFHLSSIMVMVL